MSKDKLTDYDSSTASNNSDVGGISIAEGMLPSAVNNSLRELTKQLGAFADGTDGIDVLSLADDDASHALKFQAPSAVTANVTFTLPDGDGTTGQTMITDGAGTLAWAAPYGNRNLIINGSVQVAQRSDATGVTGGAYYASDRFQSSLSSIGTWNIENVTDAPAGFSNSHKLTCTAPTGTLSANDNALLAHRIEAQNLQQLNYGSAGAKAITISFYVKSNKTGNASLEINQQDTSPIRAVALQYTINTANTWEYKEITVAGDASGVINNDNGIGFEIYWWLRSGSTFTGGSHQTAYYERVNADRNASNLDVGATANDYWQITGVQLELGSTATPFEHRSYGDELARCQRYYEQYDWSGGNSGVAVGGGSGTNNWRGVYHLKEVKRVKPSFTTGGSIIVQGSNTNHTASSLSQADTNVNATLLNCTATGIVNGSAAWLLEATNFFMAFDAEL